MVLRRSISFLAIGMLFAMGAGCGVSEFRSMGAGDGETPPAQWTPAQAAEKIQFIGGDGFEIRQTLFGMGAYLAELTKSKIGVRRVRINRFSPMRQAEIGWNLSVEERTERGWEIVNASGTVDMIDLLRSHTLLMPVYWSPGPERGFDKSAVWLSDDAYTELAKTGKTVLNFGVSDQSINALIKNIKGMQTAMNRLRQQETALSEHKDLTLLESESEDVEWTIAVNGKETNVAAIRAKNWFGEIVVLKNRQNPLILKLTLNPLTYGAAEMAGKKEDGLKSVFGFEIANLQVQAVK